MSVKRKVNLPTPRSILNAESFLGCIYLVDASFGSKIVIWGSTIGARVHALMVATVALTGIDQEGGIRTVYMGS